MNSLGLEPGGIAPRSGTSALDRWRRWLPGFVAQTARYGAVGVAVSLLYSGLVVLFVHTIGMDQPVLAAFLGFMIALPCSYIGHWAITFQCQHRFSEGWQRFAAMSCVSFVVVVYGMHVVTHVLHWSYLVGLAFSWVVAPAINYTVLQLWVFSHRRRAP